MTRSQEDTQGSRTPGSWCENTMKDLDSVNSSKNTSRGARAAKSRKRTSVDRKPHCNDSIQQSKRAPFNTSRWTSSPTSLSHKGLTQYSPSSIKAAPRQRSLSLAIRRSTDQESPTSTYDISSPGSDSPSESFPTQIVALPRHSRGRCAKPLGSNKTCPLPSTLGPMVRQRG